MEKSKCFKLAQIAVLADSSLLPETKLDILRVLMDEEQIQKICEEARAEKEREVATH